MAEDLLSNGAGSGDFDGQGAGFEDGPMAVIEAIGQELGGGLIIELVAGVGHTGYVGEDFPDCDGLSLVLFGIDDYEGFGSRDKFSRWFLVGSH